MLYSTTSPSSPPNPDIHHVVLVASASRVHDEIVIVPGASDTGVVRPHAHPLAHGQLRNRRPGLALPRQHAVLLADAPDLPPAVQARELGTRRYPPGSLVATDPPRCHDAPGAVAIRTGGGDRLA